MKLWPFARKPDPVALSMTVRPMILNPTPHDEIEHAWYRLDAIARHCEQAAEKDMRWLGEHFPEATAHVGKLGQWIAKLDEQAQPAFRDRLRDLASRLKRAGWDPLAVMKD